MLSTQLHIQILGWTGVDWQQTSSGKSQAVFVFFAFKPMSTTPPASYFDETMGVQCEALSNKEQPGKGEPICKLVQSLWQIVPPKESNGELLLPSGLAKNYP
jgi:hypothetical protein